VELDRYLPRESPLHRADPRLKFIAAIATILAITLLPVAAYAALALAWLGIVLASLWARVGALRTARTGLIAAPFALAALPLVFTRPEDPLGTVTLGPLVLTISGEGLRMFTTILLKSWLSVQVAMLLAFTTPFHELIDALRELRVPRIIVAIISFMYRYLGVLTDEAGRMNRARAARSAGSPAGRSGGSLAWRARVTGAMVGSLFIRSYERSERVYAAMQARGFEAEFRHLAMRRLGRGELLAFALFIAALVAFLAAGQLVLPRL
jgi:cobalt/nickel transport system permease protein